MEMINQLVAFAGEKGFDFDMSLAKDFALPVAMTVGYLTLVPLVAHLGISKDTVRQFSFFHNAALCLFSAITFVRCLGVIWENGIVLA